MHSTPQLRSEVFKEIKKEIKWNDTSPEQYFSSPLLLSAYCDAHQRLEQMLGGNFLDTLPEEREKLFHRDKYQRLWRNNFSGSSVANTIEDILVIHAIGMYSQRILINRKIGVLAGGSLAILAPTTRPGDEIYAFRSNPDSDWGNAHIHLLVLRPQLIKSGIDAGNPEYETKQDDEEWGNVRHFTLIGCAWTKIDDIQQLWEESDGIPYLKSDEWSDRRTTAWVH
jgi:hypothetical protein